MGKIQEEFEESRKYELATEVFENAKLLELTQDNVARVEAMIRMDSSYARTVDSEAGPEGKYKGSSAFWMTKLKESYEKNKCDVDGYKFSDIVLNSVMTIDSENSTHLNSDRKALNDFITDKNLIENVHAIYPDYIVREIKKNICYIDAYWIIRDRIIKFACENDLKEELKKGSFELFRKIAEVTSDEITAKLPEAERSVSGARCNVSFASKFCAYACCYLFEKEPEKDNFSKYDSVVMKVLPVYASHYGVDLSNYNLTEYNSTNFCQFYQDYSAIIGEIIKNSGNQISRNGFDHLLWYYHKGHPIDD